MILDDETRNVITHHAVMFGFGVFFFIYFKIVQNNPEMQKQILENSMFIPMGQILAVEGYLGHVIVKTVWHLRENRRIDRTLPNVINFGVHWFHVFASYVIDLIGIIVTSLAFFYYATQSNSDIFGIMDISDAYFLVMVPSVFIITYLIISRRKIKYRT